ncbi:conserved hypothetical protein [Porphyromonas gingivalis ATCC 33277]|uniref:Uncharacterized protein n=1 Tax=Porphyromonas gingivalis (strain ATCC 33277 / DSM 20709 / CIP 103683 / JCM 12257 / NCTC 11834 / 2561) TaxID=431947 RepID=B2RMD8_PORG3|nr:conserved hypothetical protein [Porphyromonas gingivalis ATCC 33277]
MKEIILLVFLSRKEQTNRSANIFSSVLKGFEAQTIVCSLSYQKFYSNRKNKHKDETILVTAIYRCRRNPHGMQLKQCSPSVGSGAKTRTSGRLRP